MILQYASYLTPIIIFLFWSITFIESALSKIFDLNGNIGYFSSVLSNTFLKNMAVPIFYFILILELASGLSAFASLIALFIDVKICIEIGTLSIGLCCFTVICLFTGQRLAKDYAGASGIVGYFVAGIFSMVALFGK